MPSIHRLLDPLSSGAVQPGAPHSAVIESSLAQHAQTLWYRGCNNRQTVAWAAPSYAPSAVLSTANIWTTLQIANSVTD